MELSQPNSPVINRLKRAQGQLAAVTGCLKKAGTAERRPPAGGRVRKALDRAGFAVIATGLEQCIVQKDATMDRKDLEKLFLSLA
ncbi:MAG: cytoplasmic protein [Tessaracoccus sp.]